MSETLFKLENENKYNEVMKDHIATLTQLGDVQILSFANPNSIYFSTEFIFKDNKIFVSGNVGNAVFVTTWKPAWDYEWEKTELEYFASKLKAFDDNKYIIDLEKAEKEITRWIVEADDWEEPYEIADELVTEVLWENLFEEFEDKKISNKDNSKHFLKICSKLLEALYNADNYIEYNNSLKTLFNSDEWEYLLEFPYSDLGSEINPRIEMWLYMLRKSKEKVLGGKICKQEIAKSKKFQFLISFKYPTLRNH